MNEIENTEGSVIHGLLYCKDYLQKTLPFIKKDYFQGKEYQLVFSNIKKYVDEYNIAPTSEALHVILESDNNASGSVYDGCATILEDMKESENVKVNEEWLSDVTEKWCQDSAFFNVLMEASAVVDDKKTNISKYGLPTKMSEALAITFDSSIGHDYFMDAGERFDSWHKKFKRIPFNVEMLNRVTKGGLPTKTLTVLMSSKSGGFKSGAMCSFAANNLMDNKDVLYITMELAEEVVAERVDANLLGVDLDDLRLMSKNNYIRAVEKNKEKTKGRLVVKEYPTSTAHSGHFRFLLQELKSKSEFEPDIIYIDYLNICSSAKLNANAASNSYLYVKTIAEELRALAVEFDVPVMSATQSGRQAIAAADLGMEDVSESIGLISTVDLLLGLITTPDLDQMNQIIFKQLKNRFGDVNKNTTFPVGVKKAQMKLFDCADNQTLQPSNSTGGVERVLVADDNVDTKNQDETMGYSVGKKSKREKFKDFKC